jgi:hypothetical protein
MLTLESSSASFEQAKAESIRRAAAGSAAAADGHRRGSLPEVNMLAPWLPM